ncbi:MAG: lytic transglycosylase F, partial [Candidatus Electrothrix sp. EH2]|nr:lytic transglycosylase F [Candidatus Electrothrix sp. EH2]
QEYTFPPLLLAALAYQESELDSARHSKNNKIGIMGIDPSALRQEGLEADLTTIQRPEGNIRLAVRYLDFLRDHYFSAPELGESDRNLMALAAYTSGPIQVMAARKKAALAGYNPDIWFKQVETAMQSEEGQNVADIAQYVRNIYNYFKAYEYVLEKSGNESQQE